jgi:hypothetical protein
MKTLVVSTNSDGAWLASHLESSLYNDTDAGNGFIPKQPSIDKDLWDNIVYLDGPTGNPFIDRFNKNEEGYQQLILQGEDLPLVQPNSQIDLKFGVLFWHTPEGLFNKGCYVLEQNGFMNRDLGAQLSTPQGVVLACRDLSPIIMDIGSSLSLLADEHGYMGPISTNLVLSGGEVLIEKVIYGLKEGWGETLLEIQKSNLFISPMNCTENYAVGVLCSVPPYPYNFKGTAIPINGFGEEQLNHLRFKDCKKEGSFITGGSNTGKLFYATAWGRDIKEARMRIYRGLRNLDILSLQYRTDISSMAEDLFAQLIDRSIM